MENTSMTAASNSPDITVFDVADWFLERAKSENKHLKPMKLQKLIYFSYGWYYAYFDKPLFKDDIYAWRHGPVVKELYEKYNYPQEIITECPNSPNLNKNAEEILDSVWSGYSPLSDATLFRAIRKHTPWRKAWRSSALDAVISKDAIKEYFTNLIEKYAEQETGT